MSKKEISESKKFKRLLRLSNNVKFMSGRTIFKGIPGKPAPVPISITFAFLGISYESKTNKLSKKCFTAISFGSKIAVKFIFLFHSINKFV